MSQSSYQKENFYAKDGGVPSLNLNPGRSLSAVSDLGRERARDTQLLHLLDRLPGVTYRLTQASDCSLQFLYISPNCLELLGLTPDTLMQDANCLLNQIHQEDQPDFDASLMTSAELLKTWYWEGRFLLPTGQVRWVQAIAQPEPYGSGEICWNGLFLDITDRKLCDYTLSLQAERERLLSKSAQRIRQSLDLDIVLNTTVAEVRQFLQTDRVLIYRFNPDWSGVIAVESVQEPWIAVLGTSLRDPCFEGELVEAYRRYGRVQITSDIDRAGLTECHLNLLKAFQVRANLVVPIHREDTLWGLLIAHQCRDPRNWQTWEVELLQQLSEQVGIAIQQCQLLRQTQRQAQWEKALNHLTQQIHNSLDLDTIFATSAREIAQLLQTRQIAIARCAPQTHQWSLVAHYPTQTSTHIAAAPHPAIAQLEQDLGLSQRLQQLEIITSNQTLAAEPSNPPLGLQNPAILPAASPTEATIWIPLHQDHVLWGCLYLVRDVRSLQGKEVATTKFWLEDATVSWQSAEIELLLNVANQLAIAIDQSELYHQVQRLNAGLEIQIQERTKRLQQAYLFEATLKYIAERLRDSLDEHHILQTAVDELAIVTRADYCNAALYNLATETAIISYESTRAEQPWMKGQTLSLNQEGQGYNLLLQGQSTQFCLLQDGTYPKVGHVLVCPLLNDQITIGDLRLFKHHTTPFTEHDLQMAQQVANQCAIALRQARLFQAAQAQVEELQRLNRLKDDFLSTVSHELRTPMSSIKMATQMLEISLSHIGLFDPQLLLPAEQGYRETATNSNYFTPQQRSKISRYLKILQDECQREISLINDLLDLSRLDAGTEPLILTLTNLRDIVLHIAEPFAERCQNQHQNLHLDLPDHLPPLKTDLSDLERIVTELLNNACKYTPAHADIVISAEICERSPLIDPAQPSPNLYMEPLPSLILRVSNSGVQIPDNEIPNIFEKFYRIPNNDPWKHGGTGLGLALVKKLVERLNAQIWVETQPNRTTFVLQFPPEAIAP